MWFSPWMSWLSLELGRQAVTAATLLLAVTSTKRSVVRLVTGVVSTVTRDVLVLLVAAAVVIGLRRALVQ